MKKTRASVASVEEIAAHLKEKSGTKVITGGSFDLFHYGHLKFIEQASLQGDILIVGVTADDLVRSRKGESRPIIPVKERAYLISCLSFVDFVFVSTQLDWLKAGYLATLQPDYFVIGKEPATISRNTDMRTALEQSDLGVSMIEIDRHQGVSTTDIAQYLKTESWKEKTPTLEIKPAGS